MLAAILPAVVVAAVPAAAAGLPVIVTRERHGPVAVHGTDTYADVLSIALPAGRWAVAAKLSLSNTALAIRTVVCRLQAESAFNQTRAHLGSQGRATARSTPTLLMAHVYASNGTARLKCRANGTARLKCRANGATGDVAAHDIEIQAIRAGTLQQVSMGDLSGNDTYASVGSLHVGKGSWAVMAKVALQSSVGGGYASCQLVAGADKDASLGSIDPGGDNDRRSAAMLLTHAFAEESGGTLDVGCSSNSPTGAIQARSVRIVAVKAGTLTTGS